MTVDQNDPYLYVEHAERWHRIAQAEGAQDARLKRIEEQLAAVIADNADLRRCLKYVSERAGISAETLVQHNHRLIAMDTLLSQATAKLSACNRSIAHLLNFETEHTLLHREKREGRQRMNDRDIGQSADYGRPDDDGRQTLADAIAQARREFWERLGGEAQESFGDIVVFEAGDDNEYINVYRTLDRMLLSEEYVAPYGESPEQEWEYD